MPRNRPFDGPTTIAALKDKPGCVELIDEAFAQRVLDQLHSGVLEIACHPPPQDHLKQLVWEDFTDEHRTQRKICHRIAGALKIQSHDVTFTCLRFISCKDPAFESDWGTEEDDNGCLCDSHRPRWKKFSDYHFDNTYDDTECISAMPWTLPVGVHFDRKGVTARNEVLDTLRATLRPVKPFSF